MKITAAQGTQLATVSTTGSYFSSSDKRAYFGLGPAIAVQQLEIRWPSGVLQTLHDVKVNQALRIDELVK